MAFSKVPRIDMEHEDPAVRRILDYLIKQQDELEYKFMNLDSDNVYEIDFNVTNAKNLKIPDNVITEVWHEQVINVETAHILNAWIKNLFVEYLETNFDALVWGSPVTTRNYIRIINEQITFYTDTLSTSEYEPLLIPNPNGSDTMVNVFYTSIGDHPDAYKYFTITDPRLVHPELTSVDVEAFKVLVKKTVKSSIKKSILFNEVTTESGMSTVMPVNIEGEGTEVQSEYGKRRGQFVEFKDTDGKTYKQMCENNDSFTGLKFKEDGLYHYNWQTKKWIPISNNVVGGAGGVSFWKDATTFETDMFTGQNMLHYGYDSATTDIIEGDYSTFFKPNALTFLGAEVATKLPPVVPLPVDGLILYEYGVEYVPLTYKQYNGTCKNMSDHILITAIPSGVYGAGGWVDTTNTIDLTPYKTLKIEWENTYSGTQTMANANIGIGSKHAIFASSGATAPDSPAYTRIRNLPFKKQITEVDIEKINAPYYIETALCVSEGTPSGTMKIYRMWLEPR